MRRIECAPVALGKGRGCYSLLFKLRMQLSGERAGALSQHSPDRQTGRMAGAEDYARLALTSLRLVPHPKGPIGVAFRTMVLSTLAF